jgi:hypothetical protein
MEKYVAVTYIIRYITRIICHKILRQWSEHIRYNRDEINCLIHNTILGEF